MTLFFNSRQAAASRGSHRAAARLATLAVAISAVTFSLTIFWTTAAKGQQMSYGDARQFLAKHTKLIELTNQDGARVAICPEWQGRVMTSSCDGLQGMSFGFINREYIESGQHDQHFANFGGEDRFWLSPEGGPYSLWFKPGVEQVLANWYTPAALNEGAWPVTSGADDPYYRMQQPMRLQNTAGTDFELDVTRDVRLLNEAALAEVFGQQPAAQMTADDVKLVAYETVNTVTNRGPDMAKEKGLVSIWMLGMLNSGPETVVVVPYKSGDPTQLGPVVKSDYFGQVPPDRLKVLPEAILFRADGEYRSKIGTSQSRAKDVLGSIDFAAGVLTLVHFTMPEDPTGHYYMNNMWGEQDEPFEGDVANSYNDGPPEPGKKGLGAFYEIESLSPAPVLKSGESLTHHHRTIHIQADLPTLNKLAVQVLGIELETVRKEMLSGE
jgi:hypothetical protein